MGSGASRSESAPSGPTARRYRHTGTRSPSLRPSPGGTGTRRNPPRCGGAPSPWEPHPPPALLLPTRGVLHQDPAFCVALTCSERASHASSSLRSSWSSFLRARSASAWSWIRASPDLPWSRFHKASASSSARRYGRTTRRNLMLVTSKCTQSPGPLPEGLLTGRVDRAASPSQASADRRTHRLRRRRSTHRPRRPRSASRDATAGGKGDHTRAR